MLTQLRNEINEVKKLIQVTTDPDELTGLRRRLEILEIRLEVIYAA